MPSAPTTKSVADEVETALNRASELRIALARQYTFACDLERDLGRLMDDLRAKESEAAQ